MSLKSTVRSRQFLSAAWTTVLVVAASLAVYFAGASLLRERQPLVRACQTALSYLTASTTATRTLAIEGPVHLSDRAVVELHYEFLRAFAGRRPGHLVCEFAVAAATERPQLLAIATDGQDVDSDLLAEINAVLRNEAPDGDAPTFR